MFKTTLYQILAISGAILGLSTVFSLIPFRPKIRVNRVLPEYATVGEKVSYSVGITNLGLKSQKGVLLYEDTSDPRPDLTALLSGREPHERLRNAWDRKIMYYRWVWLIRKSGKAILSPVKLPDLPVGETVWITSDFVPRHRGYLRFTGFSLARPDPLGLFMRLFSVKKAKKILVLPKQYPIGLPDLISRRQYNPRGVNLASSIGNSEEFMSLRHYRPGDPMRDIHWRTFAKTGELVIKEFEDEFFVRYALILDTFVSLEKEAVFEEAVSIAASYVTAVQPRDAILDLMVAGSQMYSFSSGRGLGGSEKMLEVLSCVEPCRDKTILELKATLESGLKKISSAICIFTDWDKDRQQVLRVLEQDLIPAFVIVLAQEKSAMEQKILKDPPTGWPVRVVEVGKVFQGLGVP